MPFQLSYLGHLAIFGLMLSVANAQSILLPGDRNLRNDLQLLADAGVIDIPLTSWPISSQDLARQLPDSADGNLSDRELAAMQRVHQRVSRKLSKSPDVGFSVAIAGNPRQIRGFESSPRNESETAINATWPGEALHGTLNLTMSYGGTEAEQLRPDGSFLGASVGNWLLTAGWLDQWWGPGRDSSLILSNNGRPFPSLRFQRRESRAFESKVLNWLGPWSISGFVGLLDDERHIDNATLIGVRAVFKPFAGIEIGLSRTAQLCGENRPCSLSSFSDLLIGNDNRGVNVDPAEEPGNQLAGFDVRWRLPADLHLAAYFQWIGEDTRRGGPLIGSWLRLAGMEYWGVIGNLSHRTHVEIADSSCRAGGFGFSEVEPNCAYDHGIYTTGYRYNRRPIGHGMDSDGLSYSVGSTLVQSTGQSWNATLRHMKINRVGPDNGHHSVSNTPQKITDIEFSYSATTKLGLIQIGVGGCRLEDAVVGNAVTDISGYLQWSSK